MGGWKNAQTVRRGYELNYKLIAMQLDQHQGSLPAQYSFLQVEPDNVLVTALKKVEDGNALIARYFEWAGKKTEVKLAFPGLEKAVDTDLMERQIGILADSAGTVVVPTSPYEIKTVKIETTASESK